MTEPNTGGNRASSHEPRERENNFCPFLGFEDDPETALAYAAPYNFCYHCKPIAPVSLSHQRRACLTPNYAKCRVYQQESQEPLPKEYRGTRLTSHKPKPYLPLLILLLVVLGAALVLSYLGVITIPGLTLFGPTQAVLVTTEVASVLPTEPLPTPTQEISQTPQPTSTSPATSTSSYTPHAVETPFGKEPMLLIHRVLDGEGYIYLAEQYGTTAEAIRAINYQPPDALWVGNILVIPVNTDDVTGLPMFTVREIVTEGLTIEEYADRMRLDGGALKKYNALPDEYVLKMGELIIIPN